MANLKIQNEGARLHSLINYSHLFMYLLIYYLFIHAFIKNT